jgi:hypothetical protein
MKKFHKTPGPRDKTSLSTLTHFSLLLHGSILEVGTTQLQNSAAALDQKLGSALISNSEEISISGTRLLSSFCVSFIISTFLTF